MHRPESGQPLCQRRTFAYQAIARHRFDDLVAVLATDDDRPARSYAHKYSLAILQINAPSFQSFSGCGLVAIAQLDEIVCTVERTISGMA